MRERDAHLVGISDTGSLPGSVLHLPPLPGEVWHNHNEDETERMSEDHWSRSRNLYTVHIPPKIINENSYTIKKKKKWVFKKQYLLKGSLLIMLALTSASNRIVYELLHLTQIFDKFECIMFNVVLAS